MKKYKNEIQNFKTQMVVRERERERERAIL